MLGLDFFKHCTYAAYTYFNAFHHGIIMPVILYGRIWG
ncbi:hypothetical protein HMPREF9413_3106 [Paenibacillus sp. HGF7]|nr:hypothetical protein HMPREF9413_3106 [Paenibacillus sp. HGF7]